MASSEHTVTKPRNQDNHDPSPTTYGVLVSTMNDLPGHRIVQVLGTVYGQTTFSRSFGRNVRAGIKSFAGGEVKEFTKMMYEARYCAVESMVGECSKKHGNVIIAMRFEVGSMGETWSQACSYGTACIVENFSGH